MTDEVTEPAILTTPQGRRIAFHRSPGAGPGVIFLGGFRSDMTGTKAMVLQDWAQRTGRAFVRFDYSGHGQSGGSFEDGCIGAWFEDALAVLTVCTNGPQVLVGSSMGGWIALLLARAVPDRIAGLVGIAAAPDFTEDGIWAGLSPAERAEMAANGRLVRPSEYDGAFVLSQKLIENGRDHLVLRSPLILPFPVRLLQGSDDVDVPPSVALRLVDHAESADLRLTLVKGADHRFSTVPCLELIRTSLEDLLKGGSGG